MLFKNKEVKKEIEPEADIPKTDKPAAAGFKCCRCGHTKQIVKNNNKVCGACFAPVEWKA